MEMKTATRVIWALTATALLSCAACTRTQPAEVAQKGSAEVAQRGFRPTEYQLKALVMLKRPNIYEASPTLLSRALNIAPLKEQFIDPCTPATTPVADRVVKVRINNNFDVKKTTRDMVTKKFGGGGAKPVPEPDLTPDSTTYDMKLDKTVWDATDKIIAVKIILKDDNMIFLDDKHSVTTVQAPTLLTSSFLCLAPIQYAEDKGDNDSEGGPDTPGKAKWEVVTFYVDKAQLQSRKFNIRVLVFNQDNIHVLPLILDPEVDNHGFQ